jgi:hypothetical protein
MMMADKGPKHVVHLINIEWIHPRSSVAKGGDTILVYFKSANLYLLSASGWFCYLILIRLHVIIPQEIELVRYSVLTCVLCYEFKNSNFKSELHIIRCTFLSYIFALKKKDSYVCSEHYKPEGLRFSKRFMCMCLCMQIFSVKR